MRLIGILAAGLMALAPLAAHAVFSGDMSERARSGDEDYALGKDAFEAKDWKGVIDNMARVVERRPWHDNAHTYMGYAYRQLDEYERAIHHYGRALDHHPRNRQALAYMGEAYLEMAEPEQAEALLVRLELVCQDVAIAFSDGDFSAGCDEYAALKKSYDFYMANGWLESAPKEW